MPFDLVPIEMLDPGDGTEGQIPVIGADGKFGIGDQTGGGSGSSLIVRSHGAEIEADAVSMNFVSDVTATSDGSGNVTVEVVVSRALVPLTTVVAGVPSLVWDGDNQLVMTEVPL